MRSFPTVANSGFTVAAAVLYYTRHLRDKDDSIMPA